MIKTPLFTFACAVLLGACAPAMTNPDGITPVAPTRGPCDAADAQSFVGQSASPDVQEQAGAASGASTVRTLQPGQAITKEFNGERLNLQVDAAGTIVRIHCG